MTTFTFLRENAPWLSAGVLLTFLSSFGQTFFISVFAGEIREAYTLSHGEWGGIYSLGTLASAALMVWAGGLTDQFRVRAIGTVTLILLMLSCFLIASVSVWWMLPFAIFALRFTGQGMASHIAVVAMARWFVATRGKALAIATLGFSIGEAILPLVFVSLLTIFDWRLLWLLSGLLAVSGIPVLFWLLRRERTPASVANATQSTGMLGRHWTRNDALRHRLFWFMTPALLGPSAFITAFFFHQVHFAQIKNMTHVEFVAMFPFYTVVSIAAMIGSGWAVDRYGAGRVISYMLVPIVIGFILFSYAYDWPTMLLAFFFFSISAGANVTIPGAFWAEFYGTRHIGSIKAMAAALMVLGSAIGPGLTGLGIDLGVGIETQFLGVAAFFVFATAMIMAGVSYARPQLPVSA